MIKSIINTALLSAGLLVLFIATSSVILNLLLKVVGV
jgi:hypothetical protein